MSSLLDKTELIARRAHDGQFRKDGKTLYIVHCFRVADRVKHLGEKYQAVALLHDSIEDSNGKVTKESLLAEGIDTDVIDAVVLLTKSPNVRYDNYLENIKPNDLATRVKIADMLDNLSDTPTPQQIQKYKKGLTFLLTD